MTQTNYTKTIWVNGRKTCPFTKSKIDSNDYTIAVIDADMQCLVEVLSRQSSFGGNTAQAFHDFLQDTTYPNIDNPQPDPFFELDFSTTELSCFGKTLSTCGVSRLGLAILESWVSYGVDNIYFECSHTPIYS